MNQDSGEQSRAAGPSCLIHIFNNLGQNLRNSIKKCESLTCIPSVYTGLKNYITHMRYVMITQKKYMEMNESL